MNLYELLVHEMVVDPESKTVVRNVNASIKVLADSEEHAFTLVKEYSPWATFSLIHCSVDDKDITTGVVSYRCVGQV